MGTKMSCFRNAPCFRKGKQKGKGMKVPIIIGSHPHPFYCHEQKRRGSTYQCDGCQQPGFGPYYSCARDGCDVHYHQHCGDLLRPDEHPAAPVSNHRPYPTGYLVLKESAPRKVQCCVACGDQVQGLRYKVWPEMALGSYNPYWLLYRHLNNLAFHPLCASLPKQICQTGEQEIVMELEEKIRGECPICTGNAKGWAYNSTCGVYSYHVGCVKKKIIQIWQQDEAPSDGGRRKVTIYVKRACRLTLEIAKWAFQQIIQALFGFPAAMAANIIMNLFHFDYDAK